MNQPNCGSGAKNARVIVFLAVTLLISTLLFGTESVTSLQPCPKKHNCVSSLATDSRHGIKPFRVPISAEEAWKQLRAVLMSRKEITIVSESGWYLRAEARSRWLHFVDDIEFVMYPQDRLIHFRSASRLGFTDFGVNRRRMESIRLQLGRNWPDN